MGLIELFRKKKVFLDTAPLIYFIEGNSEYQRILRQLFEANDKGEFEFLTSAITLGEVLVMPLRKGEEKLAKQYEHILRNSKYLKINEITIETSVLSAQLRAKHNLKTPDALQIASAIENLADFFFTNDKRLKNIQEINAVILEENK